MNRIFHARIAAGQYLFVALAGAIAVYGLWEKQILIAVLFMLLLVVSIEKLIHTPLSFLEECFFSRISSRGLFGILELLLYASIMAFSSLRKFAGSR